MPHRFFRAVEVTVSVELHGNELGVQVAAAADELADVTAQDQARRAQDRQQNIRATQATQPRTQGKPADTLKTRLCRGGLIITCRWPSIVMIVFRIVLPSQVGSIPHSLSVHDCQFDFMDDDDDDPVTGDDNTADQSSHSSKHDSNSLQQQQQPETVSCQSKQVVTDSCQSQQVTKDSDKSPQVTTDSCQSKLFNQKFQSDSGDGVTSHDVINVTDSTLPKKQEVIVNAWLCDVTAACAVFGEDSTSEEIEAVM